MVLQTRSARTRFFGGSRSLAPSYLPQPIHTNPADSNPVHNTINNYDNTPIYGPTPHISEISNDNVPVDHDVSEPSEQELDDMAQSEFIW